jgi:two-component system, OmpR family, phosphate regulon sensor histidine kinase PhoR
MIVLPIFPTIIAALVVLGVLLALAVHSKRQTQALVTRKAELATLRRTLDAERGSQRELATQLSAFADVTLDALLIVNHLHVILVANNAAKQIFPQAGTIINKTLMMVCRNHELDDLVDEVQKTKEELETQIALDERSYRVRALLVETQTGAVVALALQDISELVRLARARRDMVANVVHDIGTPINSIGLLLERLIATHGTNPEKDMERLNKMNVQVADLQHLHRELLELSTIESGMAIMRLVNVELTELVHGAIELVQTQAESKKQEIRNEVPVDLKVLADPDQTRRVLTNLIHNAVKFTPEQGQVRITAAVDGDMIKISVIDNGRGIPPADRNRIFERFYQVDTARSGQKAAVGAGLGLSIAKHIITSQGGTIWAEPNLPQGTIISFTLGVATNPTSAPV